MSQLVIPSNGDEPYIIFKDYNYHNLRSLDPTEVPNILLDGLSGLVHAKGWINDVLRGSVSKSLGSGWPEGIHGAAYTEFQRPLSQLGVNIQNMIMSHPLYWTDGRYGELFADEQATEDEFVRSYKAIRSLPNGKNLVTNLQDEVYNKPEYSEFRSLVDQLNVGWEERETNEKEIEKLKRELYYDFNSKYWGGYTDQDPDSPTFNQWIETPEKHFKFYDLSRQEQFELVGVSYPDFVEAEKALGLTSDGERANWRQMLDGEQGLTGLAGKTVEAGDKLREIEKEFFAEFPESRNGGIFRTNDKAEAARWVKMHDKHQSAMTAYMKAWDEWDAAADPVYDTLNSVGDKYHQEYKPNEEAEYAKKKDEFEKQIEKLQNDWEIRQNELYGQMEPFYKQMFQEQIKLFHSTFFDKKFDLPSESWEPGSVNSKSYEYDKYEPQGEEIAGVNYDLDNWIDKTYGSGASNWYRNNPNKPHHMNPFLPAGAYVPLASNISSDSNIATNSATGTSATDSAMLAGRRRKRGLQVTSYKPKGRRLQESDLNLSRRQVRMLREIKKPVSSFELLPQKLSKYKPNFKGKYSPQNTPDKTASKESDALVMSGNQKGQAWRTQDKYWSGYETQERMNIIQDRVGHGDLAWQMIVDEARQKNGWKNREIQEQLNQIAHDKGMKEQVPDYESPLGYVIHEQGASTEEELDTVMKDPLVKKVAKRLRTQIDYKDKPSRKGFPDEPPAKQQDGWHPEYGKKYKYDKLDPQSAEAMPPTGNPEIDANVEKAKPKKPRWKHINTESKVDPKVKWQESVDWRNEIEINNSESLIEVENLDDFYERKQKLNERMTTSSVFSSFDGDEDNPTEVADINTTTADAFEDSEDNALDNIMFRATDIEASGTGSGDDGGFNIGPYLAVGTETNSDGSAYQGTSTRHAFLKPIDARYIDTMIVTAIRGNGSNGGKLPTSGHNSGQDLRLMWFNEDRVDGWNNIGSWMKINVSGKSPHWTYNKNEDGSDVSSIIVPRYHFKSDYGNAYNLADPEAYPELRDWVIEIPEWCRNKNQRFAFYQQYIGFGGFNYGITEIKYQRRTPMNVVVPLDDPRATSFIRLGQGNEISDPKKRKKKVDRILKASKEYVNKIVADPFPGTDAEIGEAQGTSGNEYVPQAWDNKKQEFADAGTLDQQKDKFVSKDVELPPNYSEVQNQEDPQDTEPKYPTDKTSDELIKDLKIPNEKDFSDSKGYYKAVEAYHDKVFDIVMEKHDPLNNPNFMANTDYTPNDSLIKQMRVYKNIGETSRAVRQSAYMYQDPSKGYIDVMTGKPAQYQPPIDVKPTNSHNHPKIYPGAPETTSADHRGIAPSHYWSAEITDAIAFLYQRGPDGLVYRNIKHIGNPEKGEDPKKFLKDLMRKTNSLKIGSPPLSPLELVNYHRQYTKGYNNSPTGTHRPGEARYQSYIARIKEVFAQRGMEHNIPEDKYSSSPPKVDFRKFSDTGKGRWTYKQSIRAKAALVDFDQSEEQYKKVFDKQRKEGRHKKGDWHGYKITSKDERGLTKTSIEKKPRTYQNDREERWLKVKRAADYLLGEEKISESFDKLKKIRKKFDYEGKPTPTEDGFPEKPPAEIDPQTGFHPEYGKRVKRYGKLDPQSAESMPPTGDKDIDTTVQSQVDQKKKARKVKNLVGKNKK